MPRKTTAPGRQCARGAGFNEAAARCRGKRLLADQRRAEVQASMRPRPDAAENALPHVQHAELGRASMRPRPDAAENARERRQTAAAATLQ